MKLPKITSRTKRLLLVELRNAVQVWLILYGIMFVALLGYRYNTQRYYYNKQLLLQQQHQEQQQQNAATIASTSAAMTESSLAQDRIIEKYQTLIQSLTEDLSTTQNVIQSKLDTIETYRERLNLIQQSRSKAWQEPTLLQQDNSSLDAMPLDHWRQLLAIEKLQDLSSEQELEYLFRHAIQEMNVIVSTPSRVNWNHVKDVWEEGTQIEHHPRDVSCPESTQPKQKQPSTPIVPPDAAREQDLQEVLGNFDRFFSKRNGGVGVHALLPQTRKEVENWTLDTAETVLQEITMAIQQLEEQIKQQQQIQQNQGGGATTDTASLLASCDVDIEMISALVDAGLKAMAAQNSVREALHKTTLQYSDSSVEVILDADLPASHNNKETFLASNVINLRDVIESPLLIKSMDWIDALVDLMGGYNDKVDQYLDALAGRNSVGEVVVENVLKRAGLLNVNVKELGDKMKVPPSLQRKIIEKYR
ncbi:hypothetical protein IV203_015455 [Nitzschia inconspicua]|uniref:Uncharacterized protein n=1 Tax=Nitzschia inconspicua TaxID=303405 RepID=A0A9K3LCP3_9STRA|nr:hypothetical protein IV203_020310 [Nitzschia inconspicua]KAG7358866.1 hypothetical protein IV203_015455 [Nitzschia inconspicua]